jgi:hypothetical protein
MCFARGRNPSSNNISTQFRFSYNCRAFHSRSNVSGTDLGFTHIARPNLFGTNNIHSNHASANHQRSHNSLTDHGCANRRPNGVAHDSSADHGDTHHKISHIELTHCVANGNANSICRLRYFVGNVAM